MEKQRSRNGFLDFISPDYRVVRSPKSYNSRLGVALSLLEMNSNADVAIIEAGISEPGDMQFSRT